MGELLLVRSSGWTPRRESPFHGILRHEPEGNERTGEGAGEAGERGGSEAVGQEDDAVPDGARRAQEAHGQRHENPGTADARTRYGTPPVVHGCQ